MKQSKYIIFNFLCFVIGMLAVTGLLAQPSTANGQNDSKVTDIWVVFKTHFDLGFTDLPANVFKRYRTEMMDNALEVIAKNATQPKEKQFAWTVPGWPLYGPILGPLQTAERRSKIEQAIRKGTIVVHALPFTLQTEGLDYEDLVRGLGYAAKIARKYGQPLPIGAKMTDVPSHSWILPTLLSHAGIKFLQLGCNPASQYPRVPQLFWWEGADGSKVLCNYTPLYGSDITPPSGWPCKNYLAMQMTGDNHGPPTEAEVNKLLDFAKKKMPGVRIHLGTLDEFTRAVLAEHPELPTIKGDMPDTWIQGLMSNPRATKIAKNVRPLESALDGLNTELQLWGLTTKPLADSLAKAYEQSLLYAEHTWGMNAEYGPRYSYGEDWKKWKAAAEAEPIPKDGDYTQLKNSSAYHPEVGSKRKWLHSYAVKRQYIQNTHRIVTSGLKKRLDLLAKSVHVSGKRMVVYNPLPWKRSALVENPWVKGAFFYAKDIAASGYKTYTEQELKTLTGTRQEMDTATSFSTPYFKVRFDLKRGGISSLIEKSTGRELVDQSSKYVLGQFLHQRFSTHEVDSWFNAYSRIKTGWGLNDLGKPGMTGPDKAPYMAYTPDSWRISTGHSAVADIVTLTAETTSGLASGYQIQFMFPKNMAYVEVKWAVTNKTPEKQPEGGWLCFPFAVSQPKFTVGRLGGPINPATDIIKGTNRYLMAVNSGVSVTAPDKSGLALSPIDAPLISMGVPGLWKFSMDYIPKEPAVFVNLYNNMWNTNYPLWQQGSWSERVRIWPVASKTATVPNLVNKSWEARLPLLTGEAQGAAGKLPQEQTGLSLSRKSVLVTAFGDNPEGKGRILRLWEQAGIGGAITVHLPKGIKAKAVQPIDLRGSVLGKQIRIKDNAFTFNLPKYAPASFLFVQ
ncbi:hypothetical protein [Arachidicoccus ginsenosidivorans]|nr:hypothetical protein [Arachidicoccus ginsenosidivorans]